MISLHVIPQFFFEQQTRHLYAFMAIKTCIGLIFIFLILRLSWLLISLLVLRDEEASIHFFFSQLKAIFKGL